MRIYTAHNHIHL